MKPPLLRDDALLADVREAGRDPHQLSLWWLGQSGFLVQWRGRHVLLDPYLSDSLTVKYAGTDKPHTRVTARCIAPERLDFIDIATSSHNHTDHLDAETLGALARVNPRLQLVIPEANRAFVAERLKCPVEFPHGLDAGVSLTLDGFTFHGIPAAHNELERDAEGRHKFMGYVVEAGPWRIYHSGDTLHYEGMEDWLRQFKVSVALLPINGDRPERRVAGNLDGPQAARLAHAIGADVVIPCHYDMFEFNTASPEGFVAECRRLHQHYSVLQTGERWSAGKLSLHEYN
ncbi:MAG: MBL fold metallo-hydrolase [Verrucomicrobia bacterium]|nr:MBL fold metallo-hydrolase [Verrucomicrobiota bacterium]